MLGRSAGGRVPNHGPSQPLNVEQITKEAENFDYNPLVPLRYWLRSANTLLKEAEIYEHEGNEQQTYLLLYRHAHLVLTKLSSHPDAAAYKAGLKQAEEDVSNSLSKMEVLRPRINTRYERFQMILKERDAIGTTSDRKISQSTSSALPQQRNRRSVEAAETLAAEDNRDLAVKLAHKETRRRATARKATRQAGISEEVEHERRTAGVWGNWEHELANDQPGVDGDTLSRQMQSIRLQVDDRAKGSLSQSQRPSVTQRPSFRTTSSTFNYPTIPSKGIQHEQAGLPATPKPPPRPEKKDLAEPVNAPPIPPPKDDSYSQAPLRPAKQPLRNDSISSAATTEPASTAPTEPDLKSSSYTFKTAARLENGNPLRTMFLPPDLRQRFLKIAEPNTRSNLETCGILCGTLISNALFISKLVIPEQKSTSDTCETLNEGALFDYVDSEELMVLGWIHTHPTQTCFMSSRDLHTHSGYQVMIPESIAIVCAPSKHDWGIYRLTDPPGMPEILNCRRDGLFHPHSESQLYTDALRPGHVFEAKGLEFEVHDMRP